MLFTQQLSSSDICSEMTAFPQSPAQRVWHTPGAASVSLLGSQARSQRLRPSMLLPQERSKDPAARALSLWVLGPTTPSAGRETQPTPATTGTPSETCRDAH